MRAPSSVLSRRNGERLDLRRTRPKQVVLVAGGQSQVGGGSKGGLVGPVERLLGADQNIAQSRGGSAGRLERGARAFGVEAVRGACGAEPEDLRIDARIHPNVDNRNGESDIAAIGDAVSAEEGVGLGLDVGWQCAEEKIPFKRRPEVCGNGRVASSGAAVVMDANEAQAVGERVHLLAVERTVARGLERIAEI